jgi:hypothetical protein
VLPCLLVLIFDVLSLVLDLDQDLARMLALGRTPKVILADRNSR